MTVPTTPTPDWLTTPVPIAIVAVNVWRIALLELQFPTGDPAPARVQIAAGLHTAEGVQWLQTVERMVPPELVAAAMGSAPQGATVYEAVRNVVYQVCQSAGYIPADAVMMETL